MELAAAQHGKLYARLESFPGSQREDALKFRNLEYNLKSKLFKGIRKMAHKMGERRPSREMKVGREVDAEGSSVVYS